MNKKKLEKRKRNKEDKIWAETIKKIYQSCIICKKRERLNAHHIIPKEIKKFRHLLINGVSLCPKHHKWSLELSAHRNPFAFYLKLQEICPLKFDKLKEFWKDYNHESSID